MGCGCKKKKKEIPDFPNFGMKAEVDIYDSSSMRVHHGEVDLLDNAFGKSGESGSLTSYGLGAYRARLLADTQAALGAGALLDVVDVGSNPAVRRVANQAATRVTLVNHAVTSGDGRLTFTHQFMSSAGMNNPTLYLKDASSSGPIPSNAWFSYKTANLAPAQTLIAADTAYTVTWAVIASVGGYYWPEPRHGTAIIALGGDQDPTKQAHILGSRISGINDVDLAEPVEPFSVARIDLYRIPDSVLALNEDKLSVYSSNSTFVAAGSIDDIPVASVDDSVGNFFGLELGGFTVPEFGGDGLNGAARWYLLYLKAANIDLLCGGGSVLVGGSNRGGSNPEVSNVKLRISVGQ